MVRAEDKGQKGGTGWKIRGRRGGTCWKIRGRRGGTGWKIRGRRVYGLEDKGRRVVRAGR